MIFFPKSGQHSFLWIPVVVSLFSLFLPATFAKESACPDSGFQIIHKVCEEFTLKNIAPASFSAGGEGRIHRAELRLPDSDPTRAVLKIAKGRDEDGKILAAVIHEYQVMQDLQKAGFPAMPRLFGMLDMTSPCEGPGILMSEEGPHLGSLAGKLSQVEFISTGLQVVEATEALHTLGIVHRDLKPENILLKKNDPSQVALIDFRSANKTGVRGEKAIGSTTPEFCSFEHSWADSPDQPGYVHPDEDIFSLGITLFILRHGIMPHSLIYGPETRNLTPFFAMFRHFASSYRTNLSRLGEFAHDDLDLLIIRMFHPDSENRPKLPEVRQAFLTARTTSD